MLRAWKIGRVFGIDVKLHWSLFLIPVLHIYQTNSHTLVGIAYSLAFTFTFLLCILMHEYGHALTARMFGIGTHDIILMPLGGIARLERMAEKPLQEILIAIAGPMINVVIAALLVGGMLATKTRLSLSIGQITTVSQFATILLLTNIMMVVFNMLPAFPMDGGRVLRAFLAFFVDRLQATRVAVYVGMVVAGLFALWFFLGNFMAPLIAGFVILAGQMELMMLRRQYAEREAEARAKWFEAEAQRMLSMIPPEPDFSGFTWDRDREAWIEWQRGEPVGRYRPYLV